jgi:hypothetical protein
LRVQATLELRATRSGCLSSGVERDPILPGGRPPRMMAVELDRVRVAASLASKLRGRGRRERPSRGGCGLCQRLERGRPIQ